MNGIARLFLALCASGLSAAAMAAVTATLDRAQVAEGESVQLTLTHDGRSSEKPDLSPLKRDFDILGTGTSSSYQIVNGDLSAQVSMQLTLSPRRAGKIEIPPITWDGERSSTLQLLVGAGGSRANPGTGSNAGPSVYLTAELDTRTPYVQSAVVYTVRLHTAAQLAQAGLELAGNNDVLVQQLGKDRQTRETQDGRAFDVVERQYLLLPQRSGALKLEGPVLNAQVADAGGIDPFFGRAFGGMMNSTRPLRLHGEAIELDVRPRPAGIDGHAWLPAREVTLEETWQPDRASFKAGEPLTRHLTLRALGLTGAQLPDLAALMSLPAGLRIYPDQAKLDTVAEDGKPRGTREQNIAIIASEPGRYELPALKLAWWDVVADAQRELVLPARMIDVQVASGTTALLPAKPAPAMATAQASEISRPANPVTAQVSTTDGVGPWPWISLGLCVLWLLTLGAWCLSRRRSAPSAAATAPASGGSGQVRASAAFRDFRESCSGNDAPAARRHLLDWARAVWPQDSPKGLNALAQRLGDSELTPLLQQLDRACYAGEPWQGEALSRRKIDIARPENAKPSVLADLYP